MELTDTINTMLSNHGPLMKPRSSTSVQNVLIMPPKREAGFSSPLVGMSPSPIGTQVTLISLLLSFGLGCVTVDSRIYTKPSNFFILWVLYK